ncbi:MAG TPA: MbtH family NRPS accessory protein [Thermoanaerobaculia bacterium]|nr:MbtH family NRPS accessory protein [Thermoanaerobaculia bacterium]
MEDHYVVMKNDEEQYSIWPAWNDVPPGWQLQGEAATQDECLDRVRELWTDMRPLSLRERA